MNRNLDVTPNEKGLLVHDALVGSEIHASANSLSETRARHGASMPKQSGVSVCSTWQVWHFQLMFQDARATPNDSSSETAEGGSGLAQPVPTGGAQRNRPESEGAPDAEAQAVTDRSRP